MWLQRLSVVCTVSLFGAVASSSFFHNPISEALAALPPYIFRFRTNAAVKETPRKPENLSAPAVQHAALSQNSSSAQPVAGSPPVVRTYCHNVQHRCGKDCVDIPGDPFPCQKKKSVPKMCTRRVKRKTLCTSGKQCKRKTYKSAMCTKTVKKRRRCPKKAVMYRCRKKVKVKKTCTKKVRSEACKRALNTKCKKGDVKKEYKCKKSVSAICTKWQDCMKVRKVHKPCKKRVFKRVEVKCKSKPVAPKKKEPRPSPAVLPRRTPRPKAPSPSPKSTPPSPSPVSKPPPKYKVNYGRTPGFTIDPWPSASPSPSSAPSPAAKPATLAPEPPTPSASPSASSAPSASPSSSSSVSPSSSPSVSPSASMPPYVNTYIPRSFSNPSPSASSNPMPSTAVTPMTLAVGEAACACLNNGLDDSTEQCKRAPPSCKMMDELFDTERCNMLCCEFCGKASEDQKDDLELTDFCSAHNEYVCSTPDLPAGARRVDFSTQEDSYALERALLEEGDEVSFEEEDDEGHDADIAGVERARKKKCFKEMWVEEDSMCEKTERYKSKCPRMVGCKKKVDGTCTKIVKEIVNRPCKERTGNLCKKRIPIKYDCSKTRTVKGRCKKMVRRKGKCKVPVVVKYKCKKAVMEKVPCGKKFPFGIKNMRMCDRMVTEKYKCGSKTVKKMGTCYGPSTKDCKPKYCLRRVCGQGPPTY